MSSETFLWHDYETYGRDPVRDRPVQFAAIRTNESLEEIDDRLMIYCQQANDYLPDPFACLVHGVMPDIANRDGLKEWQFADVVHAQMSHPGTCSLGYNTIRFDDEFTRQLLFRNLFDPYAREWKNGNKRWDLIDVVRLARALRPAGIEWPQLADGTPSNKLEHLTAANGIHHGDAHDALADVAATIAMAKLIRKAQPRLYDYALKARSKHWVQQLVNLIEKPALLHVSGMYSNASGNLSIVMPICPHPRNANGVLVVDLRTNPHDLITLPWQTVAQRIFTAAADLPTGSKRIAVKTVHTNRCPQLAPLKTLSQQAAEQWQLDVNQALLYREQLLANLNDVATKLCAAMQDRQFEEKADPDLTLYGGAFATDKDRSMMQRAQYQLRNSPETIANLDFEDSRWQTLHDRLIARNWPQSLSPDSQHQWQQLRTARLIHGTDGFRSKQQFELSLEELAASEIAGNAETQTTIESLRLYGQTVTADL